ncbi:YrzI family small protein [Bacillus swezeyi]|uniref:YrzI family small protein n=1 Tax=Bacillus swezeyi TaxID=1925020 RepID=A0A5M8RPN7_9BACI|nr:YrzI family small protein [Bacillus swezeyi]KAA6449508.1 YrzI family small protein [Bacillus swezeyi]KAA6474280.1 YrzI family small protein [Bacillus swezeyi]TYS33715.1 YrzI family small protein [Bacillus swezeyi]
MTIHLFFLTIPIQKRMRSPEVYEIEKI